MNLAQRIIEYRAKNKVSQEKFGELADLDRQIIQRIESGKPCRKTTEYKILKVLEGN